MLSKDFFGLFKPGVYMWGKFQAFVNFTVSRSSQILSTNDRKLEIVDVSDRLG